MASAALTITAATRSVAERMRVADKMLNHAQASRGEQARQLKTLKQLDMLTVIGSEELGFVIVANDDQFPAVIGYSCSSFDVMPPAVEWYLKASDHAMQSVAAGATRYTPVPPPAEYPDSLGPLLTTTWNQGTPYNNLCPGGNGSNSSLYPSGCVATALSQIMCYHKYPEVGIGEHQYSFKPASGDGRILSANFGATHYAWDKMLDYYKSKYSDEEAEAVATLMLHCGVAVDMNYTSSGSGAYGVEASQALKRYFGYNKATRLYDRDYYSVEQWMQIIYRELNQRRPIYYDGVSEGSGGHAFVLDGYNAAGLIHVNWGWGGSKNGYFDIALLNPGSYKFSMGQGMIVNICDTSVVLPVDKCMLGAEDLTFSFSGNTVKRVSISASKLKAIGDDKFVGKMACVLENADTIIVLKKQEDFTLSPPINGLYYLGKLSLTSNNLSTLPDGTYRLYAASMSDDDDTWHPIRTTEGNVGSYIVTKSGSEVTWEEDKSDVWTAIRPVERLRTADNHLYDLQGRPLTSPQKRGIYIQKGRKVIR